MAMNESTALSERTVKLSPAQIEMALSEVAMRLEALSRVSIILQCELLESPRDTNAMYTLTQCVLNSTGHLVEQIARECGASSAMLLKGADPLRWQMPPLYFTDESDADFTDQQQ